MNCIHHRQCVVDPQIGRAEHGNRATWKHCEASGLAMGKRKRRSVCVCAELDGTSDSTGRCVDEGGDKTCQEASRTIDERNHRANTREQLQGVVC